MGFLGFGEVGFQFSRGFRKSCDGPILAYDRAQNSAGYGELIRRRAEEVRVALVESPRQLAEDCDILLAAVPAQFAADAAREICPYLSPRHTYLDVSASAPDKKQEMADLIRPTGAAFADLAIIGPVKVLGHQVPILASGRVPDEVYATLTSLGMQIERISDRPGEASAIKLCRSVFTKGLEALLVECAMTARKAKVDRKVLESIQHTLSQQSFLDTANRYITGNSIHADRRVHEVEEAMAMMEAMGVEPLVTRGVLERMRWCRAAGGREHFGGEQPARYEDVVDFYLTKGPGGR